MIIKPLHREGNLIVIGDTGKQYLSGKCKKAMKVWQCECKCGKTVEVSAMYLHGGRHQSCGCYGGRKPRISYEVDGIDVIQKDKPVIDEKNRRKAREIFAAEKGIKPIPKPKKKLVTIIDQERAENLANGIIEKAADDFLTHWRHATLTMGMTKRMHLARLEDVERFFLGDWIKALTKVEGTYLLDRLREEAMERYGSY